MKIFSTGRFKNWISKLLRTRKFKYFFHDIKKGHLILDVGVWSKMPEPHTQENFIVKNAPSEIRLIAVGLEPMRDFSLKYPHVLCVQADGCTLPFKNESVDVAIANAVLEHIGGSDNETNFVYELTRVSRHICYLSVPDRFCPFEVHSMIPIIHWFPFWRSIFRILGKAYWADPINLRLYTKKRFVKVIRKANPNVSWKERRQFFGPIPVSLIAKGIHESNLNIDNNFQNFK